MRFQFTATLLLTLIVTLFLTTAVLAADSRAITPRSTPSLTRRSPYLTQFSERDSSISYDVRFKRAFLKQRRRVESFCRWVWELVVREVKPSRYAGLFLASLLFGSLTRSWREDIFYLRIQEDTIFVSSELLLAGSELQRHLVGNRDDKNECGYHACVLSFVPKKKQIIQHSKYSPTCRYGTFSTGTIVRSIFLSGLRLTILTVNDFLWLNIFDWNFSTMKHAHEYRYLFSRRL